MRAMTRFLGTLSVLLLLAGATNAYAVPEMEVGKTVRQLAANSATASVVVRGVGASRACALTLMLFDATTPIGRIWYDTLLQAFDSGALVDIAYERNGTNCQITQIIVR
jgi:hypothetical protein